MKAVKLAAMMRGKKDAKIKYPDARHAAVDGFHGILFMPVGASGKCYGHVEHDGHEKAHGEAEPDHEPGLAEAVDFHHAVVDDV